ncbi:MAG: D-aminoacyl-tRNA deacylase [bacterium]
MRAVVQRVTKAGVSINQEIIAGINKGLVILLGVGKSDTVEDACYLADKIVNLRMFPDGQQNMNLSGLDVGAELLVVSQFTLYGDCRQGKRPDFTRAAPGKIAEELYDEFIKILKGKYPLKIAAGRFGAMMEVSLDNDGPVTLIVESKKEESKNGE